MRGTTESLLSRFEEVEKRLYRAKLPFETDMLADPIMEVSMYEMMKSILALQEMIKDIGFPRFEHYTTTITKEPQLTIESLNLCPICGAPECRSEHK